jgi:antitoxin CcdA
MRKRASVMPARRAVNLSLDAALVAEAKALDVNVPRAAEDALREKVREAKARRWQEDNAEAIQLSNEELAKNGLWSDGYRLF